MKFIDVKSAIIGVLITLLFLSIYGFRPEADELGHLVVKSITVEDDRGVVMGYMGNGYMQTYNTFGEPTALVIPLQWATSASPILVTAGIWSLPFN